MKTDIKSLLEFAGVDTSKGQAKCLVENYNKEEELSRAVEDLELENVFYHDGQIYVHGETIVGDQDVFWEWGENDGYVTVNDTEGEPLGPEVKARITELDPVKNSGDHEEAFDHIHELRKSYNVFRNKQDYEEGRGDHEYDMRKDQEAEQRFEDR